MPDVSKNAVNLYPISTFPESSSVKSSMSTYTSCVYKLTPSLTGLTGLTPEITQPVKVTYTTKSRISAVCKLRSLKLEAMLMHLQAVVGRNSPYN